MSKLVRITTIPLSLEKLLEGQLTFMNKYYDVVVVSADQERLKKYGLNNKVRIYHVEMTRAITPLKDLQAIIKLFRYLKKEKPLIVHTHTPKAGLVGMMAAKMAGVPIKLHTVAGLPLLETSGLKRKVLNFVEKLTYSFANKVYPNSKGLEEIILQENFASIRKLKVLGKGSSNGIDTSYFNPELYSQEFIKEFRSSIGVKEESFVFVFVGRLVSEKGINELITAFKKLHEDNPNVKLLLVGPFEKDLDPIDDTNFKILKSHKAIISVGYKEDVRPYLAISDVLAFPSYREGFPNVVMQAGAMNLPSIVTNINGCNEIINHNKNGIIIPVKDSISLHHAMNQLVNDGSILEDLKKNARANITMNYEREQFWNLLLAEYKELEAQYILSKKN